MLLHKYSLVLWAIFLCLYCAYNAFPLQSRGIPVSDENHFNFRIDKALKVQFVDACRSRDDEASKVLRRFIRAYLEQHRQTDIEEIIRRQSKK
jgi:hypothetical protein